MTTFSIKNDSFMCFQCSGDGKVGLDRDNDNGEFRTLQDCDECGGSGEIPLSDALRNWPGYDYPSDLLAALEEGRHSAAVASRVALRKAKKVA